MKISELISKLQEVQAEHGPDCYVLAQKASVYQGLQECTDLNCATLYDCGEWAGWQVEPVPDSGDPIVCVWLD